MPEITFMSIKKIILLLLVFSFEDELFSQKSIELNGIHQTYNKNRRLSKIGYFEKSRLKFGVALTYDDSSSLIKYINLYDNDLMDQVIFDRDTFEAEKLKLYKRGQKFEIEIVNQKQEIKDQKEKNFLFLIISISIGLFLVIAIISFFNIRKQKKKIEAQNDLINQQKTDLESQKTEVEYQKHLIEEKHREITDSINYAERIQRSFLATKVQLDEHLKDYFVLFQPKDVVSGDFYWAHTAQNGNFTLVTADSTGHGVPGAIMSLLNTSSLEKAVESGITEPSDILNHTRQTIIERLKKDGSAEGGKDGMDCSLICFNKEKTKLIYAAANNPIWIIRNNELIELSPDKIPVGKHDRDSVSFTQHSVDIKKGDMIYTLTDGFPDQFGGPKGKKFMYKKLKEILMTIAHKPTIQQQAVLKDTLRDWMGNTEQVDDITIIGIRV